MALVLADRVQQQGSANTTVSFTLSSGVTGYQSFSVVGNGNTTYYAATDASGNWEVGIGTYSTTGPTLTRTTIISSSNSGSAVSTFGNPVTVFVTYPEEYAVFGNGTVLTAPSGAILPTGNGGTGLTTFTSGGAVYATSTSALTTGTLPVASGGTGLTSLTAGYVPYGNGTSALSNSSAFTYGSTGLSLTGYTANTTTSVGWLNVGSGSYSNSFSGQIATFSGADTSNLNVSLQNTNNGATSYAAYAVGGNSYGSTYYMEMGSNSASYSYTSAGYPNNAFSLPYANFIESGGGDLAIGTWSSNAIHFLVNGSTNTNDAMTINTSGAIAVNGSYGTTNYVLTSQGSGSPPIWAAPAASGPTKAQAIAYAMTLGF